MVRLVACCSSLLLAHGLCHGAEATTLTPSSPGKPSSFASLFEDPVVAKGKGVEVRKSQVSDAFTAFKASLAAKNQTLREEERTFREAQLLDRLIITQLMTNRATAGDKAVAKGLAEKFTGETKKGSNSEEGFRRQLKAMGLTLEQFDQRVMEQALVEAVLDREVKSKISVSDGEIEEFYKSGRDVLLTRAEQELERMTKDPNTTLGSLADGKKQVQELRDHNLKKLQSPEKVRVTHLLIATRDRDTEDELPDEVKKIKRQAAEKLLARARAGEDFGRLVEEFSEDRNVKQTRGEYVFSKEDPFVAEFKAASFSLNPGQLSDIVTTIFGYHIIKLHEKLPPKKIEFEKVKTDIRDHLAQQQMQKQLPDYFEALKKEAGVEILDPKYKMERRSAGVAKAN